jgi:hypothetical protein
MVAMTDLVSRPPGPRAPRRPPDGPPARPVTVAGALAALQAAGLGVLAVMVLVLVGWATAADTGASATTAVRGALQVWLVGHHTRLAVPGGEFALVPVGLTALPALLLYSATLRAGRSAEVTGRRGVIALVSAVTATYAVVATVVAVLARTTEVRPLPLSAFAGAAGLAALAASAGSVRATRRWLVLWVRVPQLLRLALPAAAGAVGVLVAGGAVVTGGALAVHHTRTGQLVDALDPGAGGLPLLLLGCVLYVPTAALWGTAYAVGPGFAVGAGTSVTPFGADLGPVPAFPLLGALPQGTGAGTGLVALLVPVAAGTLAALLLRRGLGRPGAPPADGWRPVAEVAALTGAAVVVATAALGGLVSGAAGPGRLADVGPDWWAVGPLAGAEVAAVAAAVLLLLRHR